MKTVIFTGTILELLSIATAEYYYARFAKDMGKSYEAFEPRNLIYVEDENSKIGYYPSEKGSTIEDYSRHTSVYSKPSSERPGHFVSTHDTQKSSQYPEGSSEYPALSSANPRKSSSSIHDPNRQSSQSPLMFVSTHDTHRSSEYPESSSQYPLASSENPIAPSINDRSIKSSKSPRMLLFAYDTQRTSEYPATSSENPKASSIHDQNRQSSHSPRIFVSTNDTQNSFAYPESSSEYPSASSENPIASSINDLSTQSSQIVPQYSRPSYQISESIQDVPDDRIMPGPIVPNYSVQTMLNTIVPNQLSSEKPESTETSSIANNIKNKKHKINILHIKAEFDKGNEVENIKHQGILKNIQNYFENLHRGFMKGLHKIFHKGESDIHGRFKRDSNNDSSADVDKMVDFVMRQHISIT